jgi:hypothetical protein
MYKPKYGFFFLLVMIRLLRLLGAIYKPSGSVTMLWQLKNLLVERIKMLLVLK